MCRSTPATSARPRVGVEDPVIGFANMAEGNAEEVSNACVRHENGRAQRGSPEAGLLGPSPTASARAPGPFRAAPVQPARTGRALAVCREQVRAHELRGREHVDGRFAAQARDDDRANRLYSDAVVLNPAVLQRAPAPRDDGCSWPRADFRSVATGAATAAGYRSWRPARTTALQRERPVGGGSQLRHFGSKAAIEITWAVEARPTTTGSKAVVERVRRFLGRTPITAPQLRPPFRFRGPRAMSWSFFNRFGACRS